MTSFFPEQIPRNATVTVDASDQIISASRKRKLFYVRNTSQAEQVITIAYDSTNPVVDGAGLVLAVGEFLMDSQGDKYRIWDGDIRAISSAAGGRIAIMETPEDEG
jgi:hypothetical protein